MAFSDVHSPPTLPPLTKYDVFISFNGKDTRNGFTSHLHSALCRNQIETFIDYRIEKGGEIWEELVQAIRDSSVYLVIFSENYASSKWCLRELTEIIRLTNMTEKGYHRIIPVFYMIEPTHVRKQTGSYYDVTESDFVEGMVQIIVQKLDHKYTNELRIPFIYDQNYTSIESILSHSKEVQTIGIWGMGGIGKTTIATAIFQEFSHKYEGSCFLANVREESSRHGLNYIFNKLLCELLKEDVRISTPKIVSSAIVRRLRRKKVFIVLDDVNTSELLENLLGTGQDYLGVGSKVIVTTRDKHVLLSRSVDYIHEVTEMSDENSLKLFSLNAFNTMHPPENGYWDLSKRALAYGKGNPLALKVLGSFLHSKSEREWDNALKKLRRIPNADIQKVLRLSFSELDETEKDIFLDIACFFKGEEKEKVARILNECGFFADIGIRNILNKALISIATNQSIQMHDLIQEMGHKIVREESIKNPAMRSRVWLPDEICNILKNDKGSSTIETLYLDMTRQTEVPISSNAFRKMPKLRLLALADNMACRRKRNNNTLKLPENLELPNNLRYIQWDGCPLKSLTTSSWPNKLVELSMPYNNLEKLWDGVQYLPSLELIDVKCSRHMIECPDLSGAPNLKAVWLVGCDSLTHVHPSVFSLQKLQGLYVYCCKELKSLSSNNCSPSLQSVVAYGCPNLQEFSVPIAGDHSGIHLHLRSTALKKLPSSIVHLKDLGHFSFPISDSLMDLPANFANQISLSDPTEHQFETDITLHKVLPSPVFQSVRSLMFDNCCSFTKLPEKISLLSSLVHLNLYHCTNVISLPESIKYLLHLQVFNAYQCEKLQNIPLLPPSLKSFRVWDCKSLKTVLSTRSEASRKDEGAFLFLNCTNLDEDSYNTILKDAIVKTELRAKSLQSTTESDNQEEAFTGVDHHRRDCFVDAGEICYLLPVRGSKIHDLFHAHSTQGSTNIELPPDSNVVGFAFYLVLSQEQWRDMEEKIWYNVGDFLSFGCECYLETNWGEKVHIKSSSLIQWHWDQLYHRVNIMSDHALLWYDENCCKKIMETIKRRKDTSEEISTCNANFTYKFFAGVPNKVEAAIKECGIRWIYQTDVEEEGSRRCKSKRRREQVYVLDAATSEDGFDEPPTKKFKQSLLEAYEVENLRKKLEEDLHI